MLVQKAPTSLVPKCGACGLFKQCNSPKIEPLGRGRRKILIVAEGPGEDEDKQGKWLQGNSSRVLVDMLRQLKIDVERDCVFTSAIICHPKGGKIEHSQVEYCRPNLVKVIEDYKPEIIVPLGGAAVVSVLGHVYKEHDIGGIARWAGWRIPCQKINTWICPTYHPSYLLRAKHPVADKLFFRHLQAMSKLEGRPWKEVPNYKSQIKVVLDVDKAARLIREMTARGGWAAFDYEANMLRPDSDDFQIVCCSICWRGKLTIAFPWYGEAVVAMKEFLRAKSIKKIASNLKYEERATKAEFGFGVKEWGWDTMIGAHVIDNRPTTTSIKFQSFIHLGTEAYDEHISPYLKAKKGKKENRVKSEIDMTQLLTYCGLDSLLEYKVAVIQRSILGLDMKED